MSGPRKPIVPEATQELQASQILDVLEGLPAASRPRERRPLGSQSSIAPVGLDLAAGRDSVYEDDDIQVTAGVVVPPRRRNLGKVVIGAVAACALILVAAGVTRVSQASSEPSSPAKAGTPTTEQPTATTATPTTQPPPRAVTSPSPGTVGVRAPDSSSTGTVRLDRPAAPGKVWIDGKKISATSVLLTCGTHQIKVGHGRKHSIDVPCGGEIAITK